MAVFRPHLKTANQQPGLSAAEAKFESAQDATRKLRDSEAKTVQEKMKRLRALRLAKEASGAAPPSEASPQGGDADLECQLEQ